MTTRFTISGTDYDYYADRVVLSATDVDGEADVYVDNTGSPQWRTAKVLLRFEGVMEAANGNADGVSFFQIWHEGLKNNTITVRPDTSDATTIDMTITGQAPEAIETEKGVYRLRKALSLKSIDAYEGSDSLWDDLKDYTQPI